MIFEDYIVKANRRHMEGLADGTKERMGQAYFNELFLCHPKLAEAVVNTENDCFYDDEKLSRFLEFVQKNW